MPEDICYQDPTLGLKDLYDKLQRGPGVAAIEPAAAQFGKLASSLAASPDALHRALQGTGIDWRGQAADAASGAIGSAGQWAQKAGADTRTGTAKISDYASSFAALKAAVAAPVPVPTLSKFGSIVDNFAPLSDHAQAVKTNRDNAIKAYQALAEHERRTNAAIVEYPNLETAPPVTQPPRPDATPPGALPVSAPPPGTRAHGDDPNGHGRPGAPTAPAYTSPQNTPPMAPSVATGPSSPVPSAPGSPGVAPAGPPGILPPLSPPSTGPGSNPGIPAGRGGAGTGVLGWPAGPGSAGLGEPRLLPRGATPPGGTVGRPAFGPASELIPGGRAPNGAPGAMPPPIVGNAPVGNQPILGGPGRDYRERRGPLSDERFEVPYDDDVTDGVIGPESFTQ